MALMIITGMSGAGKSKAVNALEDAGYYCVDNLPPRFLLEFARSYQTPGEGPDAKIAVVVDARSKERFADLFDGLDRLRAEGIPYKILFLDSGTDVLVQRYKESRRRHPMMEPDNPAVREAIEKERVLLADLRGMADYVIDTSQTIPTQLKERILSMLGGEPGEGAMMVSCISFGFRNGLPPEADLVFDVRCLPNPYYVPELREHTGQEESVRDYVMKWPQSRQLMEKLEDLLAFLMPLYVAEGKSQLVIAAGCTGGKHRSVATAERLGRFLREKGYQVAISHRDKDKGGIR